MKLDLLTLCLVWQRIEIAAKVPTLFHDRMTPAIVRRRRERFLRWVGPFQVYALMDAARARELPRAGKRHYARHWPDEERRRRLGTPAK